MLNLDNVRQIAKTAKNKQVELGQYWEILALASRITGHTVRELHEAFMPLRDGKLLTSFNHVQFRDYVGTVITILAEMGIDIQLEEGRLSLWA